MHNVKSMLTDVYCENVSQDNDTLSIERGRMSADGEALSLSDSCKQDA